MPPLKNANREKLARKYVKAFYKDKGEVRLGQLYKEVHPNAKDSTCHVEASRILKNPTWAERVKELSAIYNPPEAIAEDIARLRSAKKEVLDKDGNIVELVDNTARAAGINLTLKLHGAISDAPSIDNRSVTLHLSNDNASLLINSVAKLEAMSHKLHGLNELEYNDSEADAGRPVNGSDTQK